jgi:hypothetical protein
MRYVEDVTLKVLGWGGVGRLCPKHFGLDALRRERQKKNGSAREAFDFSSLE